MKLSCTIIFMAFCCFLAGADDGAAINPQKTDEKNREQLIYEKMVKACQEDLAATQKIEAENKQETEVKSDGNTIDQETKNKKNVQKKDVEPKKSEEKK